MLAGQFGTVALQNRGRAGQDAEQPRQRRRRAYVDRLGDEVPAAGNASEPIGRKNEDRVLARRELRAGEPHHVGARGVADGDGPLNGALDRTRRRDRALVPLRRVLGGERSYRVQIARALDVPDEHERGLGHAIVVHEVPFPCRALSSQRRATRKNAETCGETAANRCARVRRGERVVAPRDARIGVSSRWGGRLCILAPQ